MLPLSVPRNASRCRVWGREAARNSWSDGVSGASAYTHSWTIPRLECLARQRTRTIKRPPEHHVSHYTPRAKHAMTSRKRIIK